MDSVELPNEALSLYFSELKHAENATEEFEEHVLLDEVEQATDFLQKAGLSNLPKIHHQGKEIPDSLVNDSIRQIHLTEKQAQTVKSRVRTLNKTLRNRQPRRKQRQDIRDVAWNLETSSTGSRSRSATPDSLDSIGGLNEESTSDDDQQLSLSVLDQRNLMIKDKLKWTSSEPIQNKAFSRHDRGDVAHLGSENVVLKGYHPLNEYSTIKNRLQRDRSGSDPTADVHLKSINNNQDDSYTSSDFHSSIMLPGHETSYLPVERSNMENDALSFEGLLKQNEEHIRFLNRDLDSENLVNIDSLSDSEYQHLKPLLWVEVTAIFDHHKIPVLKRKASSKHKRGNVFGVNLSTLVMRDMPTPTENSMVPKVYQIILEQLNERGLQEDGILRIASNKQKFDQLCIEIELKFFNDRESVEKSLAETSVHDLTGVLKKLLRELPDPVFTMELFDWFYKCSMIPVIEDKIRALNILVLMLPVEHRNTFRLLLKFFMDIISNEQFNRMSIHNVAMITAPSFFPPRLLLPKELKDKLPVSRDQMVKEINDAAICCGIMELLLRSGDSLWMIPMELATQAKESHKRAQDRKEFGKDTRTRSKKKLQRSSTQYEPGAMLSPRIKREYFN